MLVDTSSVYNIDSYCVCIILCILLYPYTLIHFYTPTYTLTRYTAKRTLRSRFRAESGTNKFWLENLSGTQLEDLPYKTIRCIGEYEKILAAVTVTDIAQLIDIMRLDDDNSMTTCIGIASPNPPI